MLEMETFAAKVWQEIDEHCPALQHLFKIKKDSLGSVITCPQPDCDRRLKNKHFVTKLIQRKLA